ncbi:hypothetical protein FRC10_010483 [Ceratobasidium sp. 414]|nr:hypothetical protein FRC10_010483 [Ceratobasidium sp. 414]
MSLLHPHSTRHKPNSPSKPTLSRRSSLGSDIFGPLSRKTAPTQHTSEDFRFTSITPQRSRSPASTVAPSSVDLRPPARPEDSDLGPFIVISGGTGCNAICEAFGKDASYVLPVSDNGGSSSEIIRVLGGPSIGDYTSSLIPPLPAPGPAIRSLLSYRFPSDCTEREAREMWRDIVEGKSKIWAGIPPDRKETIRGFLVYFESELLKRAHKNFCFRNGSLGNYFLAAAQGFFRSLPSAIFLFSSITGSQAHVLPVLVTSHVRGAPALAAEAVTEWVSTPQSEPEAEILGNSDEDEDDDDEDGTGTSDTNRLNVMFTKALEGEGAAAYEKLESRINRKYLQ